jgi:hypothetical protein
MLPYSQLIPASVFFKLHKHMRSVGMFLQTKGVQTKPWKNAHLLWLLNSKHHCCCCISIPGSDGCCDIQLMQLQYPCISAFLSNKPQVPPPQPCVVVISGPSGVGKDAVIKRLQELRPDLYFVVTATSRWASACRTAVSWCEGGDMHVEQPSAAARACRSCSLTSTLDLQSQQRQGGLRACGHIRLPQLSVDTIGSKGWVLLLIIYCLVTANVKYVT